MQASSVFKFSLTSALLVLALVAGSANGKWKLEDCCGQGKFCCGPSCLDERLQPLVRCAGPPSCIKPETDECCPPEAPDCCGGICTVRGNGCGIIPGDCKHLCEAVHTCLLYLSMLLKDPCEADPKVMGPCEAAISSWSFIEETGTCEHFLFGGCEGTANRFDSEAECEETCNVVDDCCPEGEFCCDKTCLLDGTLTFAPCGPSLCKCEVDCICTTEFAPVCDPSTGTTYSNACQAECDGVDPGNLEEGECDAIGDRDCNSECCPAATPYCHCGGCAFLENPDFPVLCAAGSPTSCCENPEEPCSEPGTH